jgi:hypothetical protein
MSLLHNRISRLLLPLTLLAASACATQGSIHPPVDDLKAAVEAKPTPTADIATSQKAADDYSASVEDWGDRLSSAGGRLCRWSERVYKVKVGCPKAKDSDDGR